MNRPKKHIDKDSERADNKKLCTESIVEVLLGNYSAGYICPEHPSL